MPVRPHNLPSISKRAALLLNLLLVPPIGAYHLLRDEHQRLGRFLWELKDENRSLRAHVDALEKQLASLHTQQQQLDNARQCLLENDEQSAHLLLLPIAVLDAQMPI